jgi:amino acid transporter
VSLLFIVALSVVNFIGISESVVINMVMAFVEIVGLVIVMIIGIWHVAEGNADFGVLTEFDTGGTNWALAIVAGVALSFFAMTGFENTANVAEETVDPHRSFPRSLIGGMIVAGVIYVLVSMAAALTVPTDKLAGSDAALLEVVKTGILPFSSDLMTTLFAIIAMVAITNTTLVVVVTQPRILYGMANEDVVPDVFAKIHATRRSPWVGLVFSATVVCALLVIGTVLTQTGAGLDLVARLATVTVVFLLFIYALVIVAALMVALAVPDGAVAKQSKTAVKPAAQTVANPTVVALSKLSGKTFDVAFMRELIPVHEEAIEIVMAATLNANHPELLQWNQRVIDRKGDQTRKMLSLLQEFGTAPGKRNASQVTPKVKTMRSLGGENLEKVYMPMMIDHFSQSIAISKLALTKSSNQSIKDLAASVVGAETREQTMLRKWLKDWYKQ